MITQSTNKVFVFLWTIFFCRQHYYYDSKVGHFLSLKKVCQHSLNTNIWENIVYVAASYYFFPYLIIFGLFSHLMENFYRNFPKPKAIC